MLRARDEAMAQRTLVSVRFDTLTATLELRVRGVVLSRAALGHAHGSRSPVRATRSRTTCADSVTARRTSRMIARRGAAVESLVVSRLGRVPLVSQSAATVPKS